MRFSRVVGQRIAWVGLALATAGGLLGLTGWAVLRASLPVLEGRVLARGLHGEVEILRDPNGVPHIFAGASVDAYFGLGYVHAQDRLWQMELQRRIGAGTLSEIFGARTLNADRFVRTLGLRRVAAANLASLDWQTQQALGAYAAGVNALLAEGRMLPPEFLVLRVQPAAWTPADSLVWLKMMAWNLSGNFWDELVNVRLRDRLSAAEIAQLQPPYPGDQPFRLPALEALTGSLDRAAKLLMETALPGAVPGVGSNAWVVDGSRTQSGKPMLANDPHLMLGAPGIWYFAHLHAPDLNVIGATLPGLPTVILGRNQRVAWGYTNTRPDTQDLYVERMVAGDPERYLTPEGSRRFDLVHERIAVKGAAAEDLVVRSTRHGPVVSDIDPRVAATMPADSVLALAWVGLRTDDLTLQFTIKAATARNSEELRSAAADLHAPQQSVLYADVDGAVGFVAAGRVPLRRPDNDLMGLVPSPGWQARYDWEGFVPFDLLPHNEGAPGGKLVSANQKVTPPGYPYWMTTRWAPPYRADRIAALLDATALHGREDFARIQLDERDLSAVELLPLLLSIPERTGRAAELLAELARWDGNMGVDRREPVIFAEWTRQLGSLLYPRRLGDLSGVVGEHDARSLRAVLTAEHGRSRWCQTDLASSASGDCAALMVRAFDQALAALDERLGRDRRRWTWGQAHPARWEHRPLGDVPLLGRLFNVGVPAGGSDETINALSYSYDLESHSFLTDSAPSFRAIYDLGDPERSTFVLAPGQSGHPLSPFYRDMAATWVQGRYLPMVTERETVERDAVGRLVLVANHRRR